MRYLLPALALVVALLYFTIGLRVGYITLTPTAMWNATGENTYTLRTVVNGQRAGMTGYCEVQSGTATIRLFEQGGRQVAGQVCSGSGKRWTLNAMGQGPAGLYRLTVSFDKFTGKIALKETYKGR